MNEIIPEMVGPLRGEANRYAVSIRTDLGEGLPKVTANHIHLQQVLMNLMLNGIEEMKDTGGVLTTKSQVDDGRGLISVSDTGVGLPADKVDQIFNALFTTKTQGTGMGLAISRSIVELYGARLWATANDGRGASFHFTLPIGVEKRELHRFRPCGRDLGEFFKSTGWTLYVNLTGIQSGQLRVPHWYCFYPQLEDNLHRELDLS